MERSDLYGRRLQKCIRVSSAGFWVLSGLYCTGIFDVCLCLSTHIVSDIEAIADEVRKECSYYGTISVGT